MYFPLFCQRKTLYINCVHNKIFPKIWGGQMHYCPPPSKIWGGGDGPLAPPPCGGPHVSSHLIRAHTRALRRTGDRSCASGRATRTRPFSSPRRCRRRVWPPARPSALPPPASRSTCRSCSRTLWPASSVSSEYLNTALASLANTGAHCT